MAQRHIYICEMCGYTTPATTNPEQASRILAIHDQAEHAPAEDEQEESSS